METQQMMELLLATVNASMKKHMQEMTTRMDVRQPDQNRPIQKPSKKEWRLTEKATEKI
jgi:hypothetical protein